MTFRPSPKRGRTTLMLMGGLIFAGEIAAGFLIDRVPLKIRFPQVTRVVNSLRQLESSKAILFFGSSRFGNAVSAGTVAQVLRESNATDGFSVFNAALGAGDPIAMEFLTGQLLAAGIQPWVVVIEILPEVLARRNLWLRFHLGRQFSWPDVWHALPDLYLGETVSLAVATRFNAVYTFRSEFQQWATEALNLPFASANFRHAKARKRKEASPLKPADFEVLRRGAAFAKKSLRGYEIGGLNTLALNRMIERYSKLGTTVVLVAPPVSSPYRTAYRTQINEAYIDYMRRLGDIHSAYFFDYRDRLRDDQFYTSYYTTIDGKLHFSELVAREVLVPLLNGAGKTPLQGVSVD
jgi:hypothetical protein